jgi:hypothetical protein
MSILGANWLLRVAVVIRILRASLQLLRVARIEAVGVAATAESSCKGGLMQYRAQHTSSAQHQFTRVVRMCG